MAVSGATHTAVGHIGADSGLMMANQLKFVYIVLLTISTPAQQRQLTFEQQCLTTAAGQQSLNHTRVCMPDAFVCKQTRGVCAANDEGCI